MKQNESSGDNNLSSIDHVNNQFKEELLNHHDTDLYAAFLFFSHENTGRVKAHKISNWYSKLHL